MVRGNYLHELIMIVASLLVWWCAVAAIGDMLFKQCQWFDWKFFIGVLLYLSCPFYAVYCFHRKDFGSFVLLWNAVSVLISVGLALIVFKEKITSPKILMFVFSIMVIICGYFDK